MALLAALAVGSWVTSGAGGWRAAAGLAFLLAAAAWAGASWWSVPSGRLTWDGARWAFAAGTGPGQSGVVTVALDLQRWLLVRWAGTRTHWVWLEHSRAPADWAALRRAVYSRADDDVPSGAEPPP
nr:hypothetical protein [Ramlibacter algicola]